MVKRVQIVRHDLAGANAFTGLEGEISVELDNDRLRLHDGVKAGGHVILNEVDVDAKDAIVTAAIAIHAADTSTHGVGVVAGTTETQTLSAKTLTAPVINGAISGDAFLDEDDLVSDAADKVASQQSIKAYIAATSALVDAFITSIAALGTAADKLIYTTGVDTAAELAFPANARTFISAANFAAMRTALQLGTAAILNTGVANTNIPKMDATGYPVANGSQITAIPGFKALKVYEASGTWTKPAGLVRIKVTVVGGGGGGGGDASANVASGGGGGGGTSIEVIEAATLGATETVTVGAAGAAGSAGSGGAGGTSSLGILATATGGAGGDTSPGTAAAGGLGASGNINMGGGAGGSPSGADGANNAAGNGGSSSMGGGGGGPSAVAAGVAGRPYGGGGGGAYGHTTGGAGAAGLVIIEEFY